MESPFLHQCKAQVHMPCGEVWSNFRYLEVLFFRLAKLGSVPIEISQLEIVRVVVWLGVDCLLISRNRFVGPVRFIVGSREPLPSFRIVRFQFRGTGEGVDGVFVGSMLLLESTRNQQ